MKSKNRLFFVAFGLCVLPACRADAASAHCTSGEFYMTNACRDCPKGCYCPYDSGDRLQLDPCGFISNSKVEDWCGRKENKCDYAGGWLCSFNDEYKACGRSDKAGVYRCPDEFPFSKTKATSITDCYITINGKNIYYKSTTCEPGQYLPVSSNDCAPCPDGFECPGGTFKANLYQDQGKQDNGKIHCIAGTYLPANSETCATCYGDYNYCPGGPYSKDVVNQGIERCPDGKKTNANKTGCETDTSNIYVQPGYFLPENSVNPKSCVGIASDKQYCPGGTFEKSTSRQGIETCIANGTVNAARTLCTIKLTKDQMKHGFNVSKFTDTNKKCWVNTDLTNFKDCVLGTNSRKPETKKSMSVSQMATFSDLNNPKPNAATVKNWRN